MAWALIPIRESEPSDIRRSASGSNAGVKRKVSIATVGRAATCRQRGVAGDFRPPDLRGSYWWKRIYLDQKTGSDEHRRTSRLDRARAVACL
jgi:hypothetical protein